jgi:hypothetical protein
MIISDDPSMIVANNFFATHNAEIDELVQKFRGYWSDIDRYKVIAWIQQFDRDHWELALKLLHKVDYYSPSRVIREFREIHAQLLVTLGRNLNNTYFCSLTPPGKSGDLMLPLYRQASELRHNRYNAMFIHVSDLPQFHDQSGIRFVFVDDFIGTGNTVIKYWENLQGFLTNAQEVCLLVLAAYEEGIEKIEQFSSLNIITNRRLSVNEKIFSESCTLFTREEKEILKHYCEISGNSWPEGYGECQSTIVFFHRAPNNTISILRCNTPSWKGLFPRY